MKHRYLPATEQDKKEMLKAIGAETIDELFADIPENVRFQKDYRIKQAKSETELTRELTKLAAKNKDAVTYASFLGAGAPAPRKDAYVTASLFFAASFVSSLVSSVSDFACLMR